MASSRRSKPWTLTSGVSRIASIAPVAATVSWSALPTRRSRPDSFSASALPLRANRPSIGPSSGKGRSRTLASGAVAGALASIRRSRPWTLISGVSRIASIAPVAATVSWSALPTRRSRPDSFRASASPLRAKRPSIGPSSGKGRFRTFANGEVEAALASSLRSMPRTARAGARSMSSTAPLAPIRSCSELPACRSRSATFRSCELPVRSNRPCTRPRSGTSRFSQLDKTAVEVASWTFRSIPSRETASPGLMVPISPVASRLDLDSLLWSSTTPRRRSDSRSAAKSPLSFASPSRWPASGRSLRSSPTSSPMLSDWPVKRRSSPRPAIGSAMVPRRVRSSAGSETERSIGKGLVESSAWASVPNSPLAPILSPSHVPSPSRRATLPTAWRVRWSRAIEVARPVA